MDIESLFAQIAAGDLQAVRTQIEAADHLTHVRNLEVDAWDELTPLHAAAKHIEADEVGWVGGKALHWASEHQPATVTALLERSADVNARNVQRGSDYESFTPLMMNASQNNDCAESTQLLIAAGADLRATDRQGRTALDIAVECELTRIPETLRRHGA